VLLSALLQPLTDSFIDKVIFEFVSSPVRGGLEIGAVHHVKKSAKQFEGKARSKKPEVEKPDVKKADNHGCWLPLWLVGGCQETGIFRYPPIPSHKLRIHTFSSHRHYYIKIL
jgi:hypothetical protein